MARIRSVHPSLFTDERWVSLSPMARVLYIGLLTDADDQGLFEWKPLQIKMRLLPADNADIPALLGEMVEVGLIARYDVSGKSIGAIWKFRKFQRPKKPNSVHPITSEMRTFVALDDASAEGDDDVEALVPHEFPTSSELSPQMEDGGWRREVGSVVLGACAPEWPSDPMAELLAVSGPGMADPAKTPNLVLTATEIHRWKLAGCDWALDVVPKVSSITAQPRGSPITTWKYFTAAVMRSRRERLTPPPEPQPCEAFADERPNRRPSPASDRRMSGAESLLAGAALAIERLRPEGCDSAGDFDQGRHSGADGLPMRSLTPGGPVRA